jgi:hypothetical protein
VTTTHRRRRGAETQSLIAAFLRANGFDHACDAGAGRTGTDILNTPGVTWEAKSRRDFSPTLGRKQADAHGGEQSPVVIRPDGYGPASVDRWPVCVPLGQYVALLRMAGYGTELPAKPSRVRATDDVEVDVDLDADGTVSTGVWPEVS